MGMLVRAGFAVGVIMVGCLFFSTVFKKKLEETIAPTIFAIITVLYIFYSFNKLRSGYIFTLILILSGGVYSLFSIIKNKRIMATVNNLLTGGLLAFLAVTIVIYFITQGVRVQLWDDLRLWGAVPKVLFYNGDLQLGPEAMIFKTMQSYYPGMQLFAFFITKTMGVFYDGGVYFAYGILGISMLVTVVSHSKKRFSLGVVLAAIVMLCLPLTFYNNMFDAAVYYLSLYIDPVLGLMLGYIFYLVYEDANKDLFSQIRFCLALVFIIQLKDSAILFAVIAIACALIMQIKRKPSQRKLTSVGIWLAATAAMVTASSLLWKIQLSRFDVGTHIGLNAPKTDDTYRIIQGFIRTLFTTDLVQQKETIIVPGLFTYASVMLVFVIIFLLIYKFIKKEDKQRFLIPTVGIFLCNILFVAGLCYMYLGLGWDVFNSYQRYVNTVMLGVLTFGVLVLMEEMFVWGKGERMLAIPTLIVVAIFVLPCNFIPQRFSPWIQDKYLWDATAANENHIATGVVRDGYKGVPRINYVMSKADTYDILHHTLYYALLDNNIKFTFKPITESLRPFYTAPTQAEQRESNRAWLLEADYIYIFDYDQRFVENFGEYFDNGASEISETSLYRVEEIDGKISLKFVVI